MRREYCQMARHEADREDLLREATALVDRVELRVPGESEPVVVGFRRDGSGSVFFGADPALHFNAASQLRRAYAGGRLLKAERGRLVSLTRRRTASEVQLVREDWDEGRSRQFARDQQARLQRLHAALRDGACEVQRQVSEGDDLLERITNWLAPLTASLPIAERPHVG